MEAAMKTKKVRETRAEANARAIREQKEREAAWVARRPLALADLIQKVKAAGMFVEDLTVQVVEGVIIPSFIVPHQLVGYDNVFGWDTEEWEFEEAMLSVDHYIAQQKAEAERREFAAATWKGLSPEQRGALIEFPPFEISEAISWSSSGC
ncbi:hypothetical protein FDI24_gp159 [Acidovorax phage ACP17]|uniref:Uncharacterized protein n=1 Tax=Acidovorax phage ACP17 TaxID=2010329 RepID=A0A218M319_9CAUD|nr:hypothetical protein FDI24_gp159 [Acidovorax phage ACP17]ASD50441.1 hypothetical protein [Acidovorax phage ACP17]